MYRGLGIFCCVGFENYEMLLLGNKTRNAAVEKNSPRKGFAGSLSASHLQRLGRQLEKV